MTTAEAFAKINLGLVVGPARPDGKHEVVTVLTRIGLSDTIGVEASRDAGVVVEGFEDTIVRTALTAFGEATGADHGWSVRIDKRIPVAAGLGGGSSDAGTALQLANELSGHPLSADELRPLAARVGADVPFFLEDGARLATGDGSALTQVLLPEGMVVVLVVPAGESKESTAAVYRRFDERGGASGFETRREAMLSALARAGRTLVATASRSARALPAAELVRRGTPFFDRVEAAAEPAAALARARELAGEEGAVLVTGSLYLLADLPVRLQRIPWNGSASA